FNVVSIKMAKEQNLPLNTSKISGVCGRLMCCLAYENDTYVETKARMPALGEIVTGPEGTGRVVGINVPREAVELELSSKAVIQVPARELDGYERHESTAIPHSAHANGGCDKPNCRRKHQPAHRPPAPVDPLALAPDDSD